MPSYLIMSKGRIKSKHKSLSAAKKKANRLSDKYEPIHIVKVGKVYKRFPKKVKKRK